MFRLVSVVMLLMSSDSIPVVVIFASTFPLVTKVIISAPPCEKPVFAPIPIPVPLASNSSGASIKLV